MSKMKDSIDQLTPMEAYQKGFEAGQADVCTVGVVDIINRGVMQGRKEVVEWVEDEGIMYEDLGTLKRWKLQLKEWGL